MKIGVVSNPLSRNNRTHLAGIRSYLVSRPDVYHVELAQFGDLPEALRRLSEQSIDLLVVNGGDGTVSSVLTELVERSPFTSIPLLAVVSGGTSNTIAADVGMSGAPLDGIVRLFEILATPGWQSRATSRRIMRIQAAGNEPPVYGMFFGCAGVCDAVELRRRLFPQTWLPDAIAATLTLIYVLFKSAVGDLERSGVLPSAELTIRGDRGDFATGRYAVVIASTLSKVFLGGDPFWDDGDESIKLTAIAAPPRGLLRNAFRLLYGTDRSQLDSSVYHSVNAEKFEIETSSRIIIDGEFYGSRDGTSVIIDAPNEVQFIK